MQLYNDAQHLPASSFYYWLEGNYSRKSSKICEPSISSSSILKSPQLHVVVHYFSSGIMIAHIVYGIIGGVEVGTLSVG